MSLRYAILGVLEAQPMSGYELGALFESSAKWVWSARLSQIYPLLATMESEGQIRSEHSTQGRRQSIRYHITPAGVDELVGWVRTTHPLAPTRDTHLLQAMWMDLLEAEEIDRVMEEFKQEHRDRIAAWEAERAAILAGQTEMIRRRAENRSPDQHERMRHMKAQVFSGMISQSRAAIEWASCVQITARLADGHGAANFRAAQTPDRIPQPDDPLGQPALQEAPTG